MIFVKPFLFLNVSFFFSKLAKEAGDDFPMGLSLEKLLKKITKWTSGRSPKLSVNFYYDMVSTHEEIRRAFLIELEDHHVNK